MASTIRLLGSRRSQASALAGAIIGSTYILMPSSILHAEAPPPSEQNNRFSQPIPSRKPIYDDASPNGPTSLPWTSSPSAPPSSRSTATSATSESPSQSSLTTLLPDILAPSSLRQEQAATAGKSAATKLATLVETATDHLTAHIRATRLFIHAHAVPAEDAFNRTMSRALESEQTFTQTISNLAPSPAESSEQLGPGAIFVVVAGMAGTIVTRNSGIFLRASVPFTLGLATAHALLPVTLRNVEDLVFRIEQRYLPPAVLNAQVSAKAALIEGTKQAEVRRELVQNWTESSARDARVTLQNAWGNVVGK